MHECNAGIRSGASSHDSASTLAGVGTSGTTGTGTSYFEPREIWVPAPENVGITPPLVHPSEKLALTFSEML